MNTSQIRGWLLQTPKPFLVRVYGDGEPRDVKLGRSFAKAAETISALDPERLEAYDSKAELLRALKCTDPEPNERGPQLPQIISADPQVALLHYYAERIAHAYEHSTEVAFTKLVEVTDRMNDRSAAIEQRLERAEAQNRRLAQEQIDEALERARELAEQQQEQGSGGLGEQMLASFMGGQRTAAPAPNGKSNGRSKAGD